MESIGHLDRSGPLLQLLGAKPSGRRGRKALEARMDAIEALVTLLVVGAIAGWLAGVIVKCVGFVLLGDIVVGVLGAVIAGYLLPAVGVTLGGGLMGAILAALIGAIILLVVIKLVRRAT